MTARQWRLRSWWQSRAAGARSAAAARLSHFCLQTHPHPPPLQLRRKGLASEALRLFIAYCASRLHVARFIAKIGLDNGPSIALFSGTLGFTELRRVEVRCVAGRMGGCMWCGMLWPHGQT